MKPITPTGWILYSFCGLFALAILYGILVVLLYFTGPSIIPIPDGDYESMPIHRPDWYLYLRIFTGHE